MLEGYDFIGDVHGCAKTLEKLLLKLDYKKQDGVYWHPSRKVIFVGDIVDRGPRIREALHIVKNMVDAGTALCIIGNHEFNALSYTTPTAASADSDEIQFVRPHNTRHNRLIAETLMQFAPFPEEWRMFLDWFLSLPVYLEFDDFRVVHACWDELTIREVEAKFGQVKLDKAFIQKSADLGRLEGRFMDRLTRGTGLNLPAGRTMKTIEGYPRAVFRTKFWEKNPASLADVVFQPDPLPEDIAQMSLSTEHREELLYYDESQRPVFFGHYWLHGKPQPLRKNVICLDYSAVKYGRLVAYRFDGERFADEAKFTWVYVETEDEPKLTPKLTPKQNPGVF